MPKFVEFKHSVTRTPVTINPNHVSEIRPEPNDPRNITVIRLMDGKEFGVEESYASVVKKLLEES